MIKQILSAAKAVNNGLEDNIVAFEASIPVLPDGKQFLVMAGLEEIKEEIIGRYEITSVFSDLEKLMSFNFPRFYTNKFKKWVDGFLDKGFSTDFLMRAINDGELIFAGEPIITIRTRLPEAIMAGSIILPLLNKHVSAATKAAHIVLAANGRNVIDISSHDIDSCKVDVAKDFYLGGFSHTSDPYASDFNSIPLIEFDPSISKLTKKGTVVVLDSKDPREYDKIRKEIDSSSFITKIISIQDNENSMINLKDSPIDTFLYNGNVDKIRFNYELVYDENNSIPILDGIIPGQKEVFLDTRNGEWNHIIAIHDVLTESENLICLSDIQIKNDLVFEGNTLEEARLYCNANLASLSSLKDLTHSPVKPHKSLIDKFKERNNG